MREIPEINDEEDEVIEYGEVHFRPNDLLVIEQVFANEIIERIRSKHWSKNYFDSNNQRRFTITFVLGQRLEFRIAIGTTLNIIVRGTNLLPGGQISIVEPEFIQTIINFLQKYNRQLRSSALVPERDLVRWRSDNKKLLKDTFDYEIPEEYLFQIDKNECDCIKFEQSTRIILQDRITKAIVEVTGTNEELELISARGRAKLYTLRELREI